MHHGFYDEFVVAGDVEEGAACTRVRQLDQRLVTQRILGKKRDDVFSPHSLHAEFYTLEDFPQPSVSLGDEGVAKLQ